MKSEIQFINNSSTQCDIFWINKQQEVPYSSIAPLSNKVQGTYEGHQWALYREKQMIYTLITKPYDTTFFIPKYPVIKGNVETSIRIKNLTSNQLSLLWLSPQKQIQYQTIKTGDFAQQHTYSGHEWLLKSTNGKVYHLVGSSKPEEYSIGDKAKQGAQNSQKPMKLDYQTTEIQGFLIKYNCKMTEQLYHQLQLDLREINKVLPNEALNKLKSKTKIFINEKFYYAGMQARGAVTHFSKQWLQQNGNSIEKVGCIQIYSVKDYLQYTIQQPAVLLHQLSHVYHGTILAKPGQLQQLIQQCYQKANKSSKYSSVSHIVGGKQKHYGMNNAYEYFAESSQAFFSTKRFRNDYYPFIHNELKQFDPIGYEMVKKVWNVDMKTLQPHLGYPEDYDPITKRMK